MHDFDFHYLKTVEFLKSKGVIPEWLYGYCQALSVSEEGEEVYRYIKENPLPDDEDMERNLAILSGAIDTLAGMTYEIGRDFGEVDLVMFNGIRLAIEYEYEKEEGKEEPAITVKLNPPGREKEVSD